MKTLDLTYANYCIEKTDIAKRNNKAKEYSNSIMTNKLSKVKDFLLMLATIVCVNTTIFYAFVDVFL